MIYFLSDAHLGSLAIENNWLHQKKVIAMLEHMSKDAASIYMLGDMFDETSLESTGKNFLFVIQKNIDAFVLKLSDYAGTHVHYLFVFIGQSLIQDSLANLLLGFLVKESQQ